MWGLPEDRSITGLRSWAFGRDTPSSLAFVVVFVAVLVVSDRFVQAWAKAPSPVYFEESIVVGAATDQPALTAVGLTLAAALIAAGRGRLLCRWNDLELGTALRWIVIPLALLAMWQSALHEYHFVYDQWHALDRMLVVGLGVGAMARSVRILVDWVDYVNQHGDPDWAIIGPRPQVWTWRPSPTFRFGEPIDRLELICVDVIHTTEHERRTSVLVVGRDDDGAATVVPVVSAP